jgi:osmotically-inducible protein OsmY
MEEWKIRALLFHSSTLHPTMGTLDDITTTVQVKAALLADPNLGARHINVDTIHGVVHLRGYVHTDRERELAGEIALVYSDTVVENELEVRPDG